MSEHGPASDPHPDPSPAPSSAPAGSGLPDNVAGALAYLLGPITGVAFFVIDKERPFVRFHAVQSIAISVVWVTVAVLFMVLSTVLGFVPILGWLVSIFLNLGLALAGFALWLWLMFQAYQGRARALPGLAPHVRRIAAEAGPGDVPAEG